MENPNARVVRARQRELKNGASTQNWEKLVQPRGEERVGRTACDTGSLSGSHDNQQQKWRRPKRARHV